MAFNDFKQYGQLGARVTGAALTDLGDNYTCI